MRRIHLIAGIIAACLTIIVSIATLRERCNDRPILICLREMIFGSELAFKPCVPGTTVVPLADTFHIKIMALEDGEALQTIIREARENKSADLASEILKAAREGKVQRISGYARLAIRLRGVVSEVLPRQVPHLAGEGICQGMVKLDRSPDGALLTSIPLLGGKYLGEATLVLPRAMFQASQATQLCIEPSFVLAPQFATDIRQNAYCDDSGRTGLFETVHRGARWRTSILIRKRS